MLSRSLPKWSLTLLDANAGFTRSLVNLVVALLVAIGSKSAERRLSIHGSRALELANVNPHMHADNLVFAFISLSLYSVIDPHTGTTTIAPNVLACEICGTYERSGRLSCCAPRGSWYKKCGGSKAYKWSEGYHVCSGTFTPLTNVCTSLAGPILSQVMSLYL